MTVLPTFDAAADDEQEHPANAERSDTDDSEEEDVHGGSVLEGTVLRR